MHTETVGYIGIKEIHRDRIEELISENSCSNMDCHEDEILTDACPDLCKGLLDEGFLTDEEYNTILNKCDVIKFYY